MKKYGYTRRKNNLLSFVLGAVIAILAWLYSISYLPVGMMNGNLIYIYQLREYQKEEKYNQVHNLAERKIEELAYKNYETERKEGESFDEYLKRCKERTAIVVY